MLPSAEDEPPGDDSQQPALRGDPDARMGWLILVGDYDLFDAARLTHDTHLDYFVSDSTVECHLDHLLVGDRQVRVLSMKEPPSQTFATPGIDCSRSFATLSEKKTRVP